MKDNKTNPNWMPYPLKTPSDNKPKYVTTVLRVGMADIKRVIKARYLEDERIHRRMEFRVPYPEHRWKGPGWYATGDQMGMGVYAIGALFRVPDRVIVHMPIPGFTEPYNGET